jgi:hypothetical protein
MVIGIVSSCSIGFPPVLRSSPPSSDHPLHRPTTEVYISFSYQFIAT